jgi:diacylglycerol kinase (ATP)
MTDETVHLFLNPTAGRGRAGQRAQRILELLRGDGLPVEMHLSRERGDLEEQVLAQVEAGASRIVVAGGDGSIHEASNGVMRAMAEAALGVIPTGTGNDFAKASEITLDWEAATRDLSGRIATGEQYRTVDIGRINDRFFANGAGIGFDAKVTKIAQSYRAPIGDLVYLFAVFRSMLGDIATPRLRIDTPERSWDGPITFANVANGPWIGGMFHVAPMAENNDGAFDLLVVGPVSRRRILMLLPKLLAGTHIPEPEIDHARVRQMTVVADEPVVSHLDGEIQPDQLRFEVEILAGALRLL